MRHKYNIIKAATVALVLLYNPIHALGWTVDKAHSRVGFSIKHLGINTVEGIFKTYSSTVIADENTGKISSVTAEVSVDSIDTGIDARDKHLKAPDLFNVAKYPKIILKTTRIKWNGNSFTGAADLTIKGITHPVKFKGKLNGVKNLTMNGKTTKRAGYSVTASINREKFGLTFGAVSEGLSMVGEEVKISLNIALEKPL
jgi:polyisoprenoid-binding protein YceI